MLMPHRAPVTTNASIALLLGIASVACTRPNPLDCTDGTCTDPAHPFCDVTGELEGIPTTCIAVTCAPRGLAGCVGDDQLTCTDSGTNYDTVRCDRGCDPAIGCRACTPAQTVCERNQLQRCDDAGRLTVETCALGCSATEPRCNQVVPSNRIGAYAYPAAPPDVVARDAIIDTRTGIVTVDGQPLDIPSFLVEANGNGAPIRVLVVGALRLHNATIGTGSLSDAAGPALAILARGDVQLTGTIAVSPLAGEATLGCITAGEGQFATTVSGGGGGGANATAGADGGAATTYNYAGGIKGLPSGTPELEPLRGGCAGGVAIFAPYQNGGGALQITSQTRIVIDAVIDARGHNGGVWARAANAVAGGGGGGGSILLEAPDIELTAAAQLRASGGDGCTTCPAPGCASPGHGATSSMAATRGADASSEPYSGGGGGGGLGRIRINTRTGSYARTASTIEDGALTTGTIATR